MFMDDKANDHKTDARTRNCPSDRITRTKKATADMGQFAINNSIITVSYRQNYFTPLALGNGLSSRD